MAVYAYLACPDRKVAIGLGKPLRDSNRKAFAFAWAFPPSWQPEAIFTVLDDCAGEQLELVLDWEERFEEVADWTEIADEDVDNLVSFETYLAGRIIPPTTYYARLRPGRPATEATGVVRRRGTGPEAVDQAFTRALHWEPTEFLRRAELGMETTEHTEITAADAADFVTGVLIKQLRPDI